MEGECKKSQLLFYPSLGCFLKCQCRRSYCIVHLLCRERASGLGILTKLSLKLPITTVNGRSSSADCWRLHGRSSLYTVLTLQCCRALLQPPGGVMVMVTCSGSFHIYFGVPVFESSAAQQLGSGPAHLYSVDNRCRQTKVSDNIQH